MKYLKIYENNIFKEKYEEMMSSNYNEFVEILKKWASNPDFKKILNSGNNEPIKITEIDVKVRDLKPTQKEIDLSSIFNSLGDKIEIIDNIIKGDMSDFKKSKIFIANGKYILDGHHRWSLVYALDPSAKIPCINIELPGANDPDKILKIVQLFIASTYGDIHIKDLEIKDNLFEEKFDTLEEKLPKIVPENIIKQVAKSYSTYDFIKRLSEIAEITSVGKIPLESGIVKESIFSQISDESEGLKLSDGIDIAADLAGIIDPTGTVDVVQGLRYLNKGEYLSAICSFISVIPYVGDIVGKPILLLIKSRMITKAEQALIRAFGKALERFDYVKLSSLAKKLGKPFEKFVEKSKEWLPKLVKTLSKWVIKFGDKYPKLKMLYKILNNNLLDDFLAKCNEWLKKLKGFIKSLTEADAIQILTSNIFDMISNNKQFVNKLNIKSKYTPNPIEIATKKDKDPKKNDDFKGVPVELLQKIKSGNVNFKTKSKIKKYENFNASIFRR
jgi:hypothetical protein